jgi:hypothetical protein
VLIAILTQAEEGFTLSEYILNNLAPLATGVLAGVVVALFTFAWIWRTRDRQLARVGALAQLESSPSLDDVARSRISARIQEEVFDILEGDSTRRAFRVQQVSYAVLALIAMGLFTLADYGWDRWARPIAVIPIVGGMALILLAVGITGVPSYEWKMPAWFRSYHPSDERSIRSRNSATAALLQKLPDPMPDGPIVLFDDHPEIAPAREYAGTEREVFVIVSKEDRAKWVFNWAYSNRWTTNVTVFLGNPRESIALRMPYSEPVKISEASAAIVSELLARDPRGISDAVRNLHDMLTLDGLVIVFPVRRRLRRETIVAFDAVFGSENISYGYGHKGKGGVVQLAAMKQSP